MATKTIDKLTLKDRLSRLSYAQAVKLLGADGDHLIRQGGKFQIEDFAGQVYLGNQAFKLNLFEAAVVIRMSRTRPGHLLWSCSRCTNTCEHVGAAFSLILEEKMALGLAAPPPERVPVESLSEEELVEQALTERAERAANEKMRLTSANRDVLWTDYTVTNPESGKTYRLALRGWERGESYCSCPDFRKNTLGTCKHIMFALARAEKRFPARVRKQPFVQDEIALHLRYGAALELRFLLPEQLPREACNILSDVRDRSLTDMHQVLRCLRQLELAGFPVRIFPDALEYIEQGLFNERVTAKVAEIRGDTHGHPLRRELLKAELLPYQLDGIAFAVGAGRAVLADDMGLGKTVQGIGVAELLAREADISKVLVVCPVSLKAQWRSEIQRFGYRDCQLVLGNAEERAEQYDNERFFTICNYEQVLRDILSIEKITWDLIILDEGQRIKNWEAKTSRVIKGLKSKFALVLSGTPLENRLDELYSVVEFVDDRRLGPAFRFLNRHRVVDEKGKVLGYKNLEELRELLKPILLRRTRGLVMKELPPRLNEIVRIAPTDEQLELHATHYLIVTTIVHKKFISEMDLLRLQKALLMCRLTANGTFLVTKEGRNHSSKLDRLDELIADLAAEGDRKVVLFSEWTTMLDLIEPLLDAHNAGYVRLDGSVPQKKRAQLVSEFRNNPECMFFISTNAGATGLNLQVANTVVNVDLPWNPAVLEQRVARAHRMGQKNPVQVFILVTEDTIEEKLLGTLAAKQELATAALDVGSEIDKVDLASGMEELKRRLEVLLGAKAEAPIDETEKAKSEADVERLARREKVAAAGGQLVSAAFSFLGELIPQTGSNAETERAAELVKERLSECLETDSEGRPQLTITLPDAAVLDNLASSLARLLGMQGRE